MASRLFALTCTALVLAWAGPSSAAGWNGLFDVSARSAELSTQPYASIRRSCLAVPIDNKWARLKPIAGLSTTEGYGSDNQAEDFSWAIMVLSGRTLAGDAAAGKRLTDLMLRWAEADAFEKTEEVNDAYYALKRQLLPLATAYSIIEPTLEPQQAERLKGWMDPLVRKIDKIFDGDVDRNNHRVLADSVLALWGSITGDEALRHNGLARYDTILAETRLDGTLELEARRGARALWYQRQTLSSLVVLAEIGRGKGIDLYSHANKDGRTLSTLVGAMMNGLSSPTVVLVYSSENHIPGPEKNVLKPDLGFLEKRGHGRHYMAWAEALSGHESGLAYQRLSGLFDREIAGERPLIDEFAGGNATCFWGHP